MTAETDFKHLDDAQRFELLEHPEAWPEDPALQAELAELLELHLALGSHGAELAPEWAPAPTSWWRRASRSGWLAAAVVVLALFPGIYTVRRMERGSAQSRDRAHFDQLAQRRTQDRLWADFFIQTSAVIRDFQQNPKVCKADREDRNGERESAVLLLQASNQLAAQRNVQPEVEQIRASLHAWLTEVSLEDGCLSPERADELRKWASAGKLETQAERMGRMLRGEGS